MYHGITDLDPDPYPALFFRWQQKVSFFSQASEETINYGSRRPKNRIQNTDINPQVHGTVRNFSLQERGRGLNIS
jgi:hypothetical protein